MSDLGFLGKTSIWVIEGISQADHLLKYCAIIVSSKNFLRPLWNFSTDVKSLAVMRFLSWKNYEPLISYFQVDFKSFVEPQCLEVILEKSYFSSSDLPIFLLEFLFTFLLKWSTCSLSLIPVDRWYVMVSKSFDIDAVGFVLMKHLL